MKRIRKYTPYSELRPKREKPKKNRIKKPEYPVFFSSLPIKCSLLEYIKRTKEDIVCIIQRIKYGYCYRDTWAIDDWFLTVVPNMIHDLRVNAHGYPGMFTGTDEENEKKWNQILSEIEHSFREANEETCKRKNKYEEEYEKASEEFQKKYGELGERLKTKEEKEREKRGGFHRAYTMNDVPEYQEILKKWRNEETALWQYRRDCFEKGMKLFHDYFWHLWD